jgi:hypothetical protein
MPHQSTNGLILLNYVWVEIVVRMDRPYVIPGNNSPPSGYTAGRPLMPPNPAQPTLYHSLPWTTTTSSFSSGVGPRPSLAVQAGCDTGHHGPTPLALSSQELPIHPGFNNASMAHSMLPSPLSPPNSRKPKAPTLRLDDWNPVKSRIIELHIDGNEPLPKVKAKIEQEFHFIATYVFVFLL